MKKHVKLFNLIAGLVMFVSLALLSGCGDDDEKKSLIDTDDPDAVSQSLTVENGTYVKGSPPAPSSDPSAPILHADNNGESLFTIQGAKIIVNNYLELGSASGFYVAVDGAEGYFKVNATKATGGSGGRLAELKRKGLFNSGRTQEDAPSFSIEVPKNIQPGEFCISYCVYDAQNRVSNIIQQCVTVTALGGAGSAFLTKNQWSLVKEEEYYNGVLEDQEIIGQLYTDTWQTSIPCQGTYQSVTVDEAEKTNYVYVGLSTAGGMSIEASEYEKYVDYESSECTPAYTEGTEIHSITGAWTYDQSTETLVLLFNIEEEQGEGYETVAESYKAKLVGSNLVLTIEVFDESSILTFQPKN